MARSIPGFFQLLSESWNLLRAKIKPIFLLSLAEFAVIVLAVLVVAATTIIVSFANYSKFSMNDINTSEIGSFILNYLPQIGTVAVIISIVLSIISAVFAVAKIYSLTVNKSFGELVSFGKSKIYRVFMSQLVIGLISFGGFWLLGIPGFIFAFLTSFTLYELVLTDLTVTQALKSSIAIVWHNFWTLFGRFLLILIGIGILRALFSPTGDQSQGVSSLSWIVDTITGWFLMVYSFLLYKSAKASTGGSSKVSLAYLVVPAVIGWIIFFSLVFFGTSFLQARGVFDDFGGKLEQLIEENKGLDLQEELNNLETTT